MARCTAPVQGHRTASGRASCPACGGSRSYGGYGNYSNYGNYNSNYKYYAGAASTKSTGGPIGSGRRKPSWSPSGSPVFYSESEIRALTPVRKNVEERATNADLRDVFLCHAWDDRKDAAKLLHDALEALGVSVWFSEKDVALGSPLLREIDKGLAKSRVGIVLVTPAFLKRVEGAGIADKELSALLARDLLVPIVHNVTYEELREVSPLLGSRSGLDTKEDPIKVVAEKLSELVSVE